MATAWIAGLTLLVLGCAGCDEGALKTGGKTASSTAQTATRTTAAAPKTVAPSYPDGTSAKDCEQYVAAMERCVKSTPKQARGPMQEQLDKQKKALAQASEPEKRAMAEGCRMGLKALEQNASCKK
jgi:hypothetical protein